MIPNIPLYDVLTPYGDEGDAHDLTIQSATSYHRVLDSTGIPSTIVWARTLTIDEYLTQR